MKLIPESWWDDFLPALLIALTTGFLSATPLSIAIFEATRETGQSAGFSFFLGWFCLMIPITLLTYFTGWKPNTQEAVMPIRKPKVKVIRLGPLRWNLVFRPAVSIMAGLLGAFLLWATIALIFWPLGLTMKLSLSFWAAIALVTALFFFFVEETQTVEKVPDTEYLALVTWLGMPTVFYRKTGEYAWLGTILGFGRSTLVSNEHKEFTDDQGFIKAGPVPFKVWHSSDSTREHREVITVPAKNRAEIKATLTLTLQTENPRLMLDSVDPALSIGEAGRQEFRETAQKFVDTDIPALHEAFGEVLQGATLITCFVPKTINAYKAGSVVRDRGDNVMFALIFDPATVDELTTRFKERVVREVHPVLRDLIVETGTDGNPAVHIATVKVDKPITEVIESLGFVLKLVTIGDIVLPGKVTDAANQASAEIDERDSQLKSAETLLEVQNKLKPTTGQAMTPDDKFTMSLAAAKENPNVNVNMNVNVVEVPNATPLTEAAAVAGSIINTQKGES